MAVASWSRNLHFRTVNPAGATAYFSTTDGTTSCELHRRVTKGRTIHPGDIRQHAAFPKADILAGCYPCQGYSQGGRRAHSDTINFLYQEFDRVLRCIHPLAFIVENVDGMRFSQNHHLLVNQLIRFRLACYRARWKVLDAENFGLAQDGVGYSSLEIGHRRSSP